MPIRRPLTGRTPTRVAPFTTAACLAVALSLSATSCSSGSDSAGAEPPAASTPAVTSTSATPSATGEPTSASPTTTKPAPTPLRTTSTAHTEPWKDKNADFGYVSKAVAVSGGVQITFDRATWLLAKDIPAWNKANPGHPVEAADDYAIGNVSTQKRTFVVRTGAKIFGSVILSDQPEPQRITAAQLVSRVGAAGEPVTCWIYHQYGGLTGDVVQLEEQYRP